MTRTAVSFYRFVRLADAEALCQTLQQRAEALAVLGTVLLATEGINASLVGQRASLEQLLDWLQQDPRLAGLDLKWSGVAVGTEPFRRLKVRVKPEIVSFGMPGFSPADGTGQRADAARWQQLLADEQTLVLDTRNSYETAVGHFTGARRPDISSFRELPQWLADNLEPGQVPRVAMYCTGGIRCEKASAWLMAQGFADVWQLDGGILGYLQQVPAASSGFQGECYVFDHRVTVDDTLGQGSYRSCVVCREPLSAADLEHPEHQPGSQCCHCLGKYSPAQQAAARERHRQQQLAEARGATHVGARMPDVPGQTGG